jgi:hypothetical protein
MGDEPDIRLVDAHPEGDRGDDDVETAGHERVLDRLTASGAEPGVVRLAASSGRGEVRGHVPARGPRRHVDDAGCRRGRRPLDERPSLGRRVGKGLDAESKVRPVEAAGDDRRVAQPQPVDDLVPDRGRGRRGEAEDRRPPDRLGGGAQAPVLRSEVVAPLAHAVRLVDDEQRRPAGGKALDHVVPGELLGREQQELDRPVGERVEDRRADAVGNGRVERSGAADVELLEGSQLVALQREERRDDKRRTRALDGGQLVDRGLAAAGRKQGKGVAPADRGPDGLVLAGQQPLVAER